MRAPSIADSTREERLSYVRDRYRCISCCEQCGICQLFHGQSPEVALAAYIGGERELNEVMKEWRYH